MKLFKLVLALPLIATTLASTAYAVPVKFAACAKDIRIKEVPNGTGVLFSEKCDQAYVLPPKSGTVSLLGVGPSGNTADVCKGYGNIEKAITSTTASIAATAARIESYNQKIKKIEDQIEEGLIPIGTTVASLEAKVKELKENLNEDNDLYIKSFNDLMVIKQGYSVMPAASGSFALESNYTELVAAYQAANPDIFMAKMPMEQSYLSIAQLGREDVGPMSAVVSITANGNGGLPISLPLLQNLREPKEGAPAAPVLPGPVMTEGVEGNIVLSVLGVCPLVAKSKNVSSITMKNLQAYINPYVVYQYYVQAHRKHHITYNLAQLAKRIESSSKKGGFLSRKTVHSLVEETKSNKWITFETYEEDPTFTYSEDYKREIKQQFLDSVLQEVAYVSFDVNGKYPSVIEPTGTNGVQAAAEGLGKCPHAYCQIAAYGLKFIDSTFGSTSAISNYIKTRDVWVEETVDETQMLPYFGSYPIY
jgi:hypothetical protein